MRLLKRQMKEKLLDPLLVQELTTVVDTRVELGTLTNELEIVERILELAALVIPDPQYINTSDYTSAENRVINPLLWKKYPHSLLD